MRAMSLPRPSLSPIPMPPQSRPSRRFKGFLGISKNYDLRGLGKVLRLVTRDTFSCFKLYKNRISTAEHRTQDPERRTPKKGTIHNQNPNNLKRLLRGFENLSLISGLKNAPRNDETTRQRVADNPISKKYRTLNIEHRTLNSS